MGLGGGTINSWDEMKQAFLKKYQDYCRTRDLKDEIFQMTSKENEMLEEYVERFQYNCLLMEHYQVRCSKPL
jgi:hypothetical protein